MGLFDTIVRVLKSVQQGGSPQGDVEKALTTADFASDLGLLQPETEERYHAEILKVPTLLQRVNLIPRMKSPKRQLNRLGYLSRLLKPVATEGAAVTEVKPTPTTVELDASHSYRGITSPSYEMLEEAIEANMNAGMPLDEAVLATLLKLGSERVALDWEDLILNSELGGTDPDIDDFDGAFSLATNDYDHGGSPVSSDLFHGMLMKLDSKFLQRSKELMFFVSPKTLRYFRAYLRKRGTELGDVMSFQASSDVTLYAEGHELVSTAMVPEALGVGADRTKALLMDPRNLYVGSMRGVQVIVDNRPSTGSIDLVWRLRTGCKFLFPEAVVNGIEIKMAAA